MADRENLVYQAKLAEQAERYDGKAADISVAAYRLAPLFPSVSLRRGFGDAGEAVHMDLLGERRQNGGGFPSRMKQYTFKCNFQLTGKSQPACGEACRAVSAAAGGHLC